MVPFAIPVRSGVVDFNYYHQVIFVLLYPDKLVSINAAPGRYIIRGARVRALNLEDIAGV
jgi:hypothetical protein